MVPVQPGRRVSGHGLGHPALLQDGFDCAAVPWCAAANVSESQGQRVCYFVLASSALLSRYPFPIFPRFDLFVVCCNNFILFFSFVSSYWHFSLITQPLPSFFRLLSILGTARDVLQLCVAVVPAFWQTELSSVPQLSVLACNDFMYLAKHATALDLFLRLAQSCSFSYLFEASCVLPLAFCLCKNVITCVIFYSLDTLSFKWEN